MRVWFVFIAVAVLVFFAAILYVAAYIWQECRAFGHSRVYCAQMVIRTRKEIGR